MHWRLYLDSDVIRYVDLQDKEYTLRIKKVERGKVAGTSGKKSAKAMIWFEGREKPMAAGSTVLQTIASLYSNDTRTWPGKDVTIYPDHNVSFGGAKVGGIRVRPTIPKVAPNTTSKSKPAESEEDEIKRLEIEEALRG